MKPLHDDDTANVKMIGTVVGILITIIIAVLIFYNIAGSIDVSSLDEDVAAAKGETGWPATNSTEATNATNAILDQSETFFTIVPIVAIVIVAAVVIGYVSKI